jgi:hypothetical protein
VAGSGMSHGLTTHTIVAARCARRAAVKMGRGDGWPPGCPDAAKCRVLEGKKHADGPGPRGVNKRSEPRPPAQTLISICLSFAVDQRCAR